MTEKIHDVIIVGSGPAGLTAAIYTARANLNPLVFEGVQPGGQLTITTEVENFPGFPDGIMGPELMDSLRKQAQKFGAQTFFQSVDAVDFSQSPYKIRIGDTEYLTKTVIIATGATAKMLNLKKNDELMGYGVSACATCDGFFYRDKEVMVVGGGDSAVEEATYLTRFAKKVTIIHRRDELRASKIMQKRALENEKIDIMWNSVVVDLIGEQDAKGLTAVVIEDTLDGSHREVQIDGLFYGIGHRPNTEIFAGKLKMDETGYIITKPDSAATEIVGVFAAGDVQDSVYRQAITAAGSGCMAAIEAERYLEMLED